MKRSISIIAFLFTVITIYGQSNHYLTKEEAPLDTTFIGPPPAFGSLLFEQDFHMYQYGKTLRDTPRGKQAVKDANTSTDNILDVFSEAFGMKLSKEDTPEIYNLIGRMKEDAGSYATRCTKNLYKRTRPYALYNEPTPVPEAEEHLRHNGSYVSGHSATGVAVSDGRCTRPARPDEQQRLHGPARQSKERVREAEEGKVNPACQTEIIRGATSAPLIFFITHRR